MPESSVKRKLRLGYIVFAALVTIEVAEYLAGTLLASGAWPYLAILALVGAWPILYYFMHISQLRHPRGRQDE